MINQTEAILKSYDPETKNLQNFYD